MEKTTQEEMMEVKNLDGLTPLLWCAAHGRTEAARWCVANGANILAAMALERPDLFREIILLHPPIPWDPAPQPGLKGRRILVTAGERDPICPEPQTQSFLTYLEAQGASVIQAWHPGGHEIRPMEVDALKAFFA